MYRENNCAVLETKDEAANFVCKYGIKADFTERTEVSEKGVLDFLKLRNDTEFMRHDWISHDIKIPEINGAELPNEFKQTDKELFSQMIAIMLTSPHNSDNQTDSKFNEGLDQFMNKLIALEMLQELKSQSFALSV